MKIIITESQYDRLIKTPNHIWVLRRYDLVKSAFDETINYLQPPIASPCSFKTFEEYESFFYEVFMDSLHPDYYLFDDFDYNGIKEVLMDLFYVELTEYFYDAKEKCL